MYGYAHGNPILLIDPDGSKNTVYVVNQTGKPIDPETIENIKANFPKFDVRGC